MNREIEFSHNLQTYRAQLIARLVTACNCGAYAEDILQKSAITMWKNYDKFEKGSSFISWAWTIVHNTMRNFLRSTSRSIVLYGAENCVETLADKLIMTCRDTDDPRLKHLEDVYKGLSAHEIALLRAIYVDGDSVAEYAAKNHRQPQTYFNTLSMLRKKIRKEINERILLEVH